MQASHPTQAIDCFSCDHGLLEHPRFYPRQMITDADLTQEQRYWRDKQRRHNRYLHGWGVVCGALVETVSGPDGQPLRWRVRVRPGYVLGPLGDEILIDCYRDVDLETTGLACAAGEPSGEATDPWCLPRRVARKVETPLYIAVRYCEFATRPVRVAPNGCGCDDSQCENSRLRDGYEIGVLALQDCPPAFRDAAHPSLNTLLKDETPFLPRPVPACPDCPKDDWVVLAKVTPGIGGVLAEEAIDNCSCRRMVMSFADAWWTCESPGSTPTCNVTLWQRATQVLKGAPLVMGRTASVRDLVLKGSDLAAPGPQVAEFYFATRDAAGKLEVDREIKISLGAPAPDGLPFTIDFVRVPPGPRSLVVKTLKGVECVLEDVLVVAGV